MGRWRNVTRVNIASRWERNLSNCRHSCYRHCNDGGMLVQGQRGHHCHWGVPPHCGEGLLELVELGLELQQLLPIVPRDPGGGSLAELLRLTLVVAQTFGDRALHRRVLVYRVFELFALAPRRLDGVRSNLEGSRYDRRHIAARG